jgi:hypothetical protein
MSQAQVMTGDGQVDIPYDNYPTPQWAVEALLSRERFDDGLIWECACGDGNISELLDKYYPHTYHSDINPENLYKNATVRDFLQDYKYTDMVEKTDYIVTNPPFSLFTEFVLQAKKKCNHKFAFFMKTNGLHGINRYMDIYCDTIFPLYKVYMFCDRVKFDRFKHTNPLEHCWLVWNKHYKGLPTIEWIPEPKPNSRINTKRKEFNMKNNIIERKVA